MRTFGRGVAAMRCASDFGRPMACMPPPGPPGVAGGGRGGQKVTTSGGRVNGGRKVVLTVHQRPRNRDVAVFVTWRTRRGVGNPGAAASTSQMANGKTRVIHYRDRHGREPVKEFLDDLARRNPRAAAKIDHYVDRHLDGRPPSAPPPNFPISSHVGEGVRELRIRSASSQYRVLYGQPGPRPVLLHALEKRTSRLPARDRELAIGRLKDFRHRGGSEPPAAGLAAVPRSPRTR